MKPVETTGGPSSSSEERAYEDLQFYTLAHGDPAFIHQHVVDAWGAQHADRQTKPIGLTFALIGLYLRVERRFTGRYVQRIHMELAKRYQAWPSFTLPDDRGPVTASDVMAAPPGPERDQAIDDWCASVWCAFQENRQRVVELLEAHQMI